MTAEEADRWHTRRRTFGVVGVLALLVGVAVAVTLGETGGRAVAAVADGLLWGAFVCAAGWLFCLYRANQYDNGSFALTVRFYALARHLHPYVPPPVHLRSAVARYEAGGVTVPAELVGRPFLMPADEYVLRHPAFVGLYHRSVVDLTGGLHGAAVLRGETVSEDKLIETHSRCLQRAANTLARRARRY